MKINPMKKFSDISAGQKVLIKTKEAQQRGIVTNVKLKPVNKSVTAQAPEFIDYDFCFEVKILKEV